MDDNTAMVWLGGIAAAALTLMVWALAWAKSFKDEDKD